MVVGTIVVGNYVILVKFRIICLRGRDWIAVPSIFIFILSKILCYYLSTFYILYLPNLKLNDVCMSFVFLRIR